MKLEIDALPSQILQRYKAKLENPFPDSFRETIFAPHPSTPQWLEWKVMKIMNELRDRFFSDSFYIEKRKKKKSKQIERNTSNRTLIEEMCEFERHLKNNQNIIGTECLCPYEFLKLVLECNAPLFSFE